MIEVVFRDFLLQSAAISALVGSRVYQNRAPQNAVYPLIVIRKRQVTPTDTHAYQPGHATTTYRILGATRDYPALVTLREGLRGLAGFALAEAVAAGRSLAFQGVGTEIQSVIQTTEDDQFDEDSQLFRVFVDWDVMHTETITPGIVP